MPLLIIIILFCSTSCMDMNSSDKKPNSTDVDVEISENQVKAADIKQQKLLKAISLSVKTTIGKELEPDINELIQLGKIQLVDLKSGHYGESGEGCIVKDGKYFFEGLFVVLNEQLSIAELASSLVHEVTHYRMLKDLGKLEFGFPVKVAAFEISAFATQYEFITELEQLKLINRHKMFLDESEKISNLMLISYRLRKNWSDKGFKAVFNKLVEYGYPLAELDRTISQLSEKECVGIVS